MTRKLALSTAAVLLALGSFVAAPSQAASVQIGTLTCRIDPGVGLVLGSSKGVNCDYRATRGFQERYVGNITKIGVDLGFTGGGTMIWGVFAPSTDVAAGALAGSYGGATAGATVGVGLAANALLGGFNHSIALQPLSVEGNKGLNVAAGIGALNLRLG